MDTISYTIGSCYSALVVTVTPSAITGIDSLCVGASVTLADAAAGGTWNSVSTGVASVTAGVVSGSASGTSVIQYTIGTCTTSVTVTVDPTPTAITGSSSICLHSTDVLGETVSGGIWTSSATAVVTINATGTPGDAYGLTLGTATITYAINACKVYFPVTVNNAPGAITGTASVCQYKTTTLSDATGGVAGQLEHLQ